MPFGPQQPTPISHAADRQRTIYVAGASGIKPIIPISETELQSQAKQALSRKAYDYIAGGAGKEHTVSHNQSAFRQWHILPRMLRDVSQRDTSLELFGRKMHSPFLTAPIGVLELAHKEGDLAVAKATSSLGVPMIFSSQASYPMESCSALMGNAPRWFQLYWSKSDELVKSLVQRAENCGCEAIVITLDTTLLGWRERDLNLAYLPFLEGKGIAQYVSDPVFQQLMAEPDLAAPEKRKVTATTLQTAFKLMNRYPGSFVGNLRSGKPLRAVRKFIDIYSRPSLNWQDIPKIRAFTKLPILLKGILHPDDAKKALEIGIDGIIVSNHGGRQIDGAVSTIEMLPEICQAVQGKIPVLLDSGVRTGADVFKALALGASAVCLGRPYAYALAIAGEAGVREYLLNMMADFELTMGLAGCKSLSEIGRACLRPEHPF
ncbi:MAG: lactate 2-monooxygenase [Saprospiraceae bacterium]|nr:lactate 2-monooxygenase [Saprospiraceae bacterium]